MDEQVFLKVAGFFLIFLTVAAAGHTFHAGGAMAWLLLVAVIAADFFVGAWVWTVRRS